MTASWLNPGSPDSSVCLTPEGMVSFNSGHPHGLAARVSGGQLLLLLAGFHAVLAVGPEDTGPGGS